MDLWGNVTSLAQPNFGVNEDQQNFHWGIAFIDLNVIWQTADKLTQRHGGAFCLALVTSTKVDLRQRLCKLPVCTQSVDWNKIWLGDWCMDSCTPTAAPSMCQSCTCIAACETNTFRLNCISGGFCNALAEVCTLSMSNFNQQCDSVVSNK